jgi:hypothetical protein
MLEVLLLREDHPCSPAGDPQGKPEIPASGDSAKSLTASSCAAPTMSVARCHRSRRSRSAPANWPHFSSAARCSRTATAYCLRAVKVTEAVGNRGRTPLHRQISSNPA